MVFLSHSVDPAAVTGDQHETPTEIAINKEDLEVLKILANFTEVSNKIKHKQLRIMLDREKRRSPSTEFCNLLESVPANEGEMRVIFLHKLKNQGYLTWMGEGGGRHST